MAFNPFKVLKGLIIRQEGTLTPSEIEITPGGTADTKTSIVSSQTVDRTLTLPDVTDTLTANAASQSLTNKTIDADLNTITNIENADIKAAAAIDATKIHDGSVDNTEFGYLNGVTSSIQTQLNTNATDISNHISDATDAHDASAISVVPTGNLTSTDAQAALVELQTQLDSVETTANAAATRELDNLTTTAINVDLLPDTAGSRDLGSSSLPFAEVHTQSVIRDSGNLELQAVSGNILLNPSGDIDANNNTITNLAAPVNASDAVTKEYADSIAAGFDPKAAVRVATTAPLGGTYSTTPSNGRFTGAATVVDGETLVAGDRVLVKDEVDKKQNGIYVYDGAGQYTRAADSDGSPASEVSSGNFTFATQGTLNSASGFVLLGNGILILNTDDLDWTQSSGGASGASRFLDNLLSPTAINQDLLPGTSNSRNLGSSSLPYASSHVVTSNINDAAGATRISLSSSTSTATIDSGATNAFNIRQVTQGATLNVQTINSAITSGPIAVTTGTGTTNTGNVSLATGNGTTASGNINIQTGTATTRGDISLNARSTQVTSGPLNIQQGQTAVPVASQQSLTISSSGSLEGVPLLTASDSTQREILTAGVEGLPQAPNLIDNGDAEGKLTSSVSIFTPYAATEAVTFQDTGDTVTLLAHGLQNGQAVSFTSITSTTGIVVNTTYFVVNSLTNTFQVASTLGGAALPLTTNGSGILVRGIPLTGTGGSPNVTSAVVSTSTLAGSKSYTLVKDAVNRQGEGWSIDFNVPTAHRARVLSIKFDYLVRSGTFVAGTSTTNSDVTVWIYDVTNAQLIQPSSFLLLSNSTTIADNFQAEFQTSATGSQYRLIFHCATTSASAYTLTVDNIVVSPSEYVFGSPISDPQVVSGITIGATTTAPTKATTREEDEIVWHREGKFLVATYTYRAASATGATAGSGTYLFTLPAGLSADTTLTNTSATSAAATASLETVANVLVNGYIGLNNSSSGPIVLAYMYNSTQVALVAQVQMTTANFISSSYYALNNAATGFRFTIKVPVQGWSASVQMADSTSTRIVTMQASGDPASATSGNPVIFPTSVFDSHSSYSTSTGRYTIPVSGYYRVHGVIRPASGAVGLQIFVNGSLRCFAGYTDAGGNGVYTGTVLVNAGDLVDLRPNGTLDAAANSVLNIERISGPSQIASSETVAASYWASVNKSASTTTAIDFDSREFDTHNSVTGTGTTSWRFTAPISGIYSVTIFNGGGQPSGPSFHIYRNGTIYKAISTSVTTSAGSSGGATLISLNAGDFIDLRPSGAVTVVGGVLSSAGTANVSIQRIGNRG